MSGFQPTIVSLKSAGTESDYKRFDSIVNKTQIGKNTEVASTTMFNTPSAATVAGFQSGRYPSNEEILAVSLGVVSVCFGVAMITRNL